MKKDKLADLECNLSRLNGNIENYNKLNIKYKDTVEELTELKDYVKSVDGYIGELENKVNKLIEYPEEQNKRIALLNDKVNKMNCSLRPLPIEEFNKLEKETNKVRPQIEMFKRNIEESRKRIEEKMKSVGNMPSLSKPLACPKITNKGWDQICEDDNIKVKPQLAIEAPQQSFKPKRRSKSPSRSRSKPQLAIEAPKTVSITKSEPNKSPPKNKRSKRASKSPPKNKRSKKSRTKSKRSKSKTPKSKGNKKYNKPKVCKMVCSRK